MTLRHSLLIIALAATTASAADTLVSTGRYVGPLPISRPAMLDSLNARQEPFDTASLLLTHLSLDAVAHAPTRPTTTLPHTPATAAAALHLIGFTITTPSWTKVTIGVDGLRHFKLYVDGRETAAASAVELLPASHEVVVKALTTAEAEADSLRISVTTADGCPVAVAPSAYGSRPYTLDDVMHARRYIGASLSPDGRWMIVSTRQTLPGGDTQTLTEVREVATGRVVERRDGVQWMPRTNRYWFARTDGRGRRCIVATDPATQAETTLATDVPATARIMLPTEEAMLCVDEVKGPEERPDVYEVIHPDDRQPGWRNRTTIMLYDLATGTTQPLTHSHDNVYPLDVSRDGTRLLLMRSESRLSQRPTTLFTLLCMHLPTLAVDTLVAADGFISNAMFSPDGRRVLVQGSPEALGGIGKNVGAGMTPSMIDIQLYMLDPQTKDVKPLTRHFNPSVGHTLWSEADDMVYFTAEDRDSINLFRMDPHTARIEQVALPEELVEGFSVATAARRMVLYAQSASNSDRLYVADLSRMKPVAAKRGDEPKATCPLTMAEDLSRSTLDGVELGRCEAWTCVGSGGDTICCRYYLPPRFDASRRYPMIVNYYGGCSPTSRNFESRYPHHAYAAQGYVVLVVNPSGATGFGQEFSARHVATAGKGPAEDIIAAVRAFTASHTFVDASHIGCIGASYGGFMTQYLLATSDIFACGISHAGISDHTSYWGEGYWGYSYSEVSMANRYPWADRELYVAQSPLYMADRIHTPLLLIHGDADKNVPVGESIQLYNALRLLERPTALVLVRDQDHHILDYEKRRRWQQTIDAWFARWLKGEGKWWEAMYPHKEL